MDDTKMKWHTDVCICRWKTSKYINSIWLFYESEPWLEAQNIKRTNVHIVFLINFGRKICFAASLKSEDPNSSLKVCGWREGRLGWLEEKEKKGWSWLENIKVDGGKYKEWVKMRLWEEEWRNGNGRKDQLRSDEACSEAPAPGDFYPLPLRLHLSTNDCDICVFPERKVGMTLERILKWLKHEPF